MEVTSHKVMTLGNRLKVVKILTRRATDLAGTFAVTLLIDPYHGITLDTTLTNMPEVRKALSKLGHSCALQCPVPR